MSRRRVVVTGLGTTSPVGGDVPTTWQALISGTSGVRDLGEEWADQPVRIAGRAAVEPTDVLDRVVARRLDRSAQFAMVAAIEAWADAGLTDGDVDGERLGVAIASGIGGVTTLLDQHDVLKERGPRRLSPLAVPMLMANAPAANVGLLLGARAGVHTPVSACASGNEGIALALDQIRLGRADVMVAGGTEAAIHALPMAAFAQMMALSKTASGPEGGDPTTVSRPWDTARDGFVLGEGAGVLVLEELGHAQARGARIYAEVLGSGHTNDAASLVSPTGSGAVECIGDAIADAGIDPAAIVHVNAHGTGTLVNDLREAEALHQVFGDRPPPVSSIKRTLGHAAGASGAFEAVAAALTVHTGIAPSLGTDVQPDPALDLDLVIGPPRRVGHGPVLSNSFGLGGANGTLILGPVG